MLRVCYLCTKTHVSEIPMCTSRLPNDGEALDDHSMMTADDDDACMFNSRSKSSMAMMKYV